MGVDHTITVVVHRLSYLDGVYGFRQILLRRIETLAFMKNGLQGCGWWKKQNFAYRNSGNFHVKNYLGVKCSC